MTRPCTVTSRAMSIRGVATDFHSKSHHKMSIDELFSAGGSPQHHCSPPPSSLPAGRSIKGGEVLLRLETEGACPALYTLVESNEHSFLIQATDGSRAWSGVLQHAALMEMAKKVKMTFEELLEVSRKALTGEKVEGMKFLYSTSLVGGEEKLELVWKKLLVSGGIKVHLGSVEMDAHMPQLVFCHMLDHAITTMATLQVGIKDLEVEKDRLTSERNVALQRLDKCVSLKEELEQDLYGKFKLVLNEKKAKIRRLMESLEHLSNQQQQAKSAEPAATTSRNDRDETDDDTDDDMSQTPSPKSDQPVSESAPPPPAAMTEGISSLLTSDWQDDRTSPPVKRRKRQPRNTDKRPEIPRVTRTLSTRRQRRSASRNSEESMEPDELLHQL